MCKSNKNFQFIITNPLTRIANSTILLLSTLSLPLGCLSGAPQDNWYNERGRDFGFIGGMHKPMDIIHGRNGKSFLLEIGKDRVQFLDENQKVFALKSAGDAPRAGTFANGKLFVITEYSDKVYVFDENGTSLYNFGSRGSGNGQFEVARGIASSLNGSDWEIFVSDEANDRVQVFDEFGGFKRKFWSVDGNPRDIAIDDNGSVYVADQASRINVFDKNGTLLRTITGVSGHPWGLSIKGNLLAVGNSINNDIVRIYHINGTFIKQFGGGGSENGKFDYTHGVSFAPNGELWVTDHYNHRVQIFDDNGTYLRQFGGYAESPALYWPEAIIADLDHYYISDTGNDRVVVMNSDFGGYRRTIAKSGSAPGQVNDPMGIALDSQGRIYVADSGNDRVQVFENNGTYIRTIGGPEVFYSPWGVAVAEDGAVFVSDSEADRILAFDSAGNLTGSWGEKGSLGHELDNPTCLQIGPEGDLYVADYHNYAIKRFSLNGELKLSINLRNHGGRSDDRYIDRSARPLSLAIREDGMIFTSGCDDHHSTEIWAFDKFGTMRWNYSKYFGNGKGSRGRVAVNQKGEITWLFERNTYFHRYNTSYRAGPLLAQDAIPFPTLVSATQEFQTTDLDISYKITDADDANVTTGILAYINGDKSFDNVIVAKTFIGDVTGKIGEEVDVNVTHSISWDMSQDWDASVGNLKLEIFAKDDRELLDLHFVTIPASDDNATPLTINRFPLQDEDFLDAYRYLLATEDPDIQLMDGLVLPTDMNTTPISPPSISGLVLWLDAMDVDADGQPDSIAHDSLVSSWKDKSGSELNATQTTNEHTPRYRDDASFPHLDFNVDWLDIVDSNLTAKEIFVVARTNIKTNYKTLLSNGATRCMLRMGSGSLYFEQAYHSFAGSDGEYKVDGFYFRKFEQNEKHILSVSLGSDSEHSGYFQNMKIGRESSSVGNHWQGNIHEILVFNRFLDDGKKQDIEWYLSKKWGISGPLPGGGYAHRLKPRWAGVNHLLARMNLRVATDAEVTRAREATTPGNVNKFNPDFRILPNGNPEKINEFTIETQRTGTYVVPN